MNEANLRKTNLVFLVVLVFLLGFGTYSALSWRAKKISPGLIGPVSVPSVTQSPVSGWKEAKGELFSFRYPPSWQERRASAGILLYGPIDEEGVFLGVQKGADTNTDDTPEKLATQALGKGEAALARKTALVDGHPSVVQERKSGGGVRFEAYIGEVNGTKLVYLESKTAESVSASRELFDQILGSFQFEE
jgi:hypothetical protein